LSAPPPVIEVVPADAERPGQLARAGRGGHVEHERDGVHHVLRGDVGQSGAAEGRHRVVVEGLPAGLVGEQLGHEVVQRRFGGLQEMLLGNK